jgi:hypothetical protein
MQNKMYHYVYRITNTKIKKYYYGARSSKNKPILDIGLLYFGSSKDKNFMAEQRNNPSNFKYKVVKILKSRKDAILFEIFLHNKFDVGKNPRFYNRAKQSSTRFDTTGISTSEYNHSTNKTGELSSNFQKPLTLEHKQKISKSSTTREKKFSNTAHYGSDHWNFGGTMTEENKDKLLKTHYKRCKINDVEFSSIKEASEILKLSHSCLGKRIRSKNKEFENYQYV